MSCKKRTISLFLVCALAGTLLTSCNTTDESDISDKFAYFINEDGTDLVVEEIEELSGSTQEQVNECLKILATPVESVDYKNPIPAGVEVESAVLEGDYLRISFNSDYNTLPADAELLLRSAVVLSLIQIEGVASVEFFIGNSPLTNSKGTRIGRMNADNFVRNVGSSLHTYQVAGLTLYYANADGNRLVETTKNVRYNSNTSIERLVVDQLLTTTAEGCQNPMPPSTKVLSVSVKDNICYVNLDDGFTDVAFVMDPNLTVYSLVNSLTASTKCTQVQITINGKSDVTYKGTIDLSKPLSSTAAWNE
ncbi:MAG: GerMN domain-containing protein [Lachnospiraceae bacterium]|jgi:germination protein M|nr:GerMN domain-containing protein [Lachnospiraceae bacterium]